MTRVWSATTIIGVLVLAAGAWLWPVAAVRAFNPQPDPPAFGLIGINPEETARLDVVCADAPLPGGVQPGPCDVTLEFHDIGGRPVKQMTATLQPGEGTFLDLEGVELPAVQRSADLLGRQPGRRMEIQPCVRPTGRGFVLATAEVFDSNTGRTTAALNPTEPRSLMPATAGQ